MYILGIDPGIEKTGFAVMEIPAHGQPQLRDYGCIRTEKTQPLPTRLSLLAADLKTILAQWKPQAAGLEQLFFSRNVKTALTVSHARGVILETLEAHAVPVREFNPSHIKMSVTGSGRADKKQIRKMLEILFGIDVKNDDTADAIACCLCTVYESINSHAL